MNVAYFGRFCHFMNGEGIRIYLFISVEFSRILAMA